MVYKILLWVWFVSALLLTVVNFAIPSTWHLFIFPVQTWLVILASTATGIAIGVWMMWMMKSDDDDY